MHIAAFRLIYDSFAAADAMLQSGISQQKHVCRIHAFSGCLAHTVGHMLMIACVTEYGNTNAT